MKYKNKKNSNKIPGDNIKKEFNIDLSLIGLLVIILIIAFVRIRLLSFPLERDEGEYAYFGQLILKGIPPFVKAFNMKLPGTSYMYALIMLIFGQTTEAIHLGLMLINLTTIVFIYLFTKKILNGFSGIVAASIYAFLSTSYNTLGQAAHATHFVNFFGIIGIYLIIVNLEKNKWYYYFISGILLSLSVFMKQSGFIFPLFAITAILFNYLKTFEHKKYLTAVFILSGGFLIPVIFFFSIFYFYGIFDKFWFWTFVYAKQYGSEVSLQDAPYMFKMSLGLFTEKSIILWILFLISFPFLFINKSIKNIKYLLLIFVILSFLSVSMGFYYRRHYFVTFLPVMSITIAVFFDYFFNHKSNKKNVLKWGSLSLFVIIMIFCFARQSDYFFRKKPFTLSKDIYSVNPFVESIYISNFIKTITNKRDKVLILGSEPQIYFYSDRMSASPYIYMYDLVKTNNYALKMQKDLVNYAEKNKPEVIVYVSNKLSWLTYPNFDQYIFTWFDEFGTKNNYKLVGVADEISLYQTEYKWNDECTNYKVKSKYATYIFKKPE